MPYPTKGESETDFVSRFMDSQEAREDYPDQKQRLAVAYSMFRERKNAMCAVCAKDFKDWTVYRDHMLEAHKKDLMKIGNKDSDDPEMKELLKKSMSEPSKAVHNNRGQSGRVFPMRFIEPGLVHYNEVGTVLVGKEALDKMAPSFVGKPIFNESHKDVTKSDFKEGKADGVIGRVWYEPTDGWFWADAIVWDDETIDNIKNGYSLSCAYDVPTTGWGTGGLHNNIPYDREVLNGEYTHLAIVSNPRYERARIIYNQGGLMKLKFWEKAKENTPSEVELTNSLIEVDGKETKLEEVVAGYKAEQERLKTLSNAKPKFGMEDVIEVDGQKVAIKDLIAGHTAHLKNASDDAMKKAHEDGKHDDKEMDNCPMCNSKKETRNAEEKEKEDKKKDDKEKMENALRLDDHERGRHAAKSLDNCVSCKADQATKDARHFEELKNAARNRPGEFKEPNLKSTADRVAEGQKRYGAK